MPTTLPSHIRARLQWSLFLLRIGVFIVMFMWTMDKFFNPAHSARILEVFYGISGSSNLAVYIMGTLQLLLVLAFVTGIKKRISYGLIFILHAASTLSSYDRYIDGFNNLLFFAAWPMLAACWALYLLRDEDLRFTL